MFIQAQEACRTPKTQDQQGNMPLHIEVKILKTDFLKKKGIERNKKNKVAFENWPIRTTLAYLTETPKVIKSWEDVFQVLREDNFQLRLLHPVKTYL